MITQAIYDVLVNDAALAGMLAEYKGLPAIFTFDPAPEDASFPYIVTAGSPVQTPYDTKLSHGRQIWRDVRCYDAANGSVANVEAIAERVRALLHGQKISATNFATIWAECDGPTVADDGSSYGRIVTLKITVVEIEQQQPVF